MPVTASQMGSTDKENLMELDSFSKTLVLFKLTWDSNTLTTDSKRGQLYVASKL